MDGVAIRVLVIDDDEDALSALGTIIDTTPEFVLAGLFPGAEPAIAALEHGLHADIALVDLELPGMSGVDVIRRIRGGWPDIELIVLTIFDARDWIFAALRAGATGYLLKGTAPGEIVEAIRTSVARGGAPMSPSIARKVIREHHEALDKAGALTAREREVLELLAKGFTYSQIGMRLGISTGTVQTYIKSMYRKLEVTTKAEAAAAAVRRGLLR